MEAISYPLIHVRLLLEGNLELDLIYGFLSDASSISSIVVKDSLPIGLII